MRPVARNVQIEGNFGDVETVTMQVDPDASAHIMSVLTDLYSDRIGAFIREYSTNAWDSHVAAGITRPIEVTIPGPLTSYFRVKDWGGGLDIEDIRKVYSQYGASSKRGSDDFNGMLGLGCKSALTYTNEFSVVSVKEGIKHQVSVSRNADGVGQMEIIDTYKTDEPSGVEIIIPVKRSDITAVKNSATALFRWWKRGMVLVNGQHPEFLKKREVAPNLYVVEGLGKDFIVMGHVAYPVPYDGGLWTGERRDAAHSKSSYYRTEFGVVYYADMGEVTFTPSREGLQTTGNTHDTVFGIREKFFRALTAASQLLIDACPTYYAAWTMAEEYRYTYPAMPLSYKGESFPTEIECPFTPPLVAGGKKVFSPWWQYDAMDGGRVDELYKFTPRSFDNKATIIIGHPNRSKPTATQRARIREARTQGIITTNMVLIVDNHPSTLWLDETPVVEWSTIQAVKLPSARAAKAAGTEKFRTVTSREMSLPQTLDTSKTVALFSPPDWKSLGYVHRHVAFDVLDSKGYSIVLLASNRWTKFYRDHPGTRSARQVAGDIVRAYEATLTAADHQLIFTPQRDVTLANNLRPAAIDIKAQDVVEYIRLFDGPHRELLLLERKQMGTFASTFGVRMKDITPPEAPFDRYPILDGLVSHQFVSNLDHIVMYINAVDNP